MRKRVAGAVLLLAASGGIYHHVARRPVEPPPAPVVVVPVHASPPAGPAAADVLAQLERAVVTIESSSAGHPAGLGSGFLVRPGLIATNYHVVSEATQARVRFKSGQAFEVEGYAAVEPALDLALLRLNGTPLGVPGLTLHYERDPVPLSSVIAVGHPHGMAFSPFDGKVSRVLNTSEMPWRVRQFLQQSLEDTSELRWIQHTARLSEGNSGGPLVNDLGQVVGVNTWVDKRTSFGYALHARHLHELTDRLFPQPAPLEAYASPAARLDAFLIQLTPGELHALAARGRRMSWCPQSAADYRELQQLALAVTFASLPFDPAADTRRQDDWESLHRAALDVAAELKRESFSSPAVVTLVNEFAEPQLDRPGVGLFLFATVRRYVEGDGGRRGVILELAGVERALYVPLDDQLGQPREGASYLMLGMNPDGRTVQFGENPLRLTVAPVVLSRCLIPLEP